MPFLKGHSARRLIQLRSSTLLQKNWVCPTCRPRSVGARRYESTTVASEPKPYYVTSPIFYVNANPHVGHLYSIVLADSLKRWQVLRGRRALFCTGTDEHGAKVQQAASKNGVSPKELCDTNSAVFKQLAEAARVSNDFFIRTTDQDHVEAVKHFWLMLREKGHIYESTHAGWYCVSDECFYPESTVERTVDPFSGRVIMASTETGNEVEWIEEKNYHFRMTALKDKLLKFYEENPTWVHPPTRMNEVTSWVKDSLDDLSISRPSKRLTWGIEVPDDPSQVIYVWVDALINYITKAGYPGWTPGREQEGGWPADVHVIGKDILRFHCVYWPALLLALDLPLPKAVLSHAHWTMDRKKMSKSRGNAVNPFDAMERFGVDVVRFYLLHEGGIADDADYNNIAIVDKYKKLLQWGIGNLTSRVTSPKMWNLTEVVEYAHAHPGSESVPRDLYVEQRKLIDELPGKVALAMEEATDPPRAIRAIVHAAGETQKFYSKLEPWNVAKTDNKELLYETVFLGSESLRICAILLQPFMPDKATQMLDWLGVAGERRTYTHAEWCADPGYGTRMNPPPKGIYGTLFPPLPVED